MTWPEKARRAAAATHRAFGLPAVYRAGGTGPGVAVTAIESRELAELPGRGGVGGRLTASALVLEVLRAAVANPQVGDSLTFADGRVRIVQGLPELDGDGATWRLDTKPA